MNSFDSRARNLGWDLQYTTIASFSYSTSYFG